MKRAGHKKNNRDTSFFKAKHSFILVTAQRPGIYYPDHEPECPEEEPKGRALLMPVRENMVIVVYDDHEDFHSGETVKVRELFYTDTQVFAFICLRPGDSFPRDPNHIVQDLICSAGRDLVTGFKEYYYRITSEQYTEVI